MKKPINVMLVDDHAVVRYGFRMLLDATEDIKVVAEAESAEAAYQLIPTAKPDVIVMDISLGGTMGVEATRRRYCAPEVPAAVPQLDSAL